MQTRIVGRSEFNLFHLLYSIVLSNRVGACRPAGEATHSLAWSSGNRSAVAIMLGIKLSLHTSYEYIHSYFCVAREESLPLVMDISDAIATGVVCSAGRVAGMAGCLLLRPEMADHAWAVQGEHWATFETMRASRV